MINKDETAWTLDSPQVVRGVPVARRHGPQGQGIPLPSDLQGIDLAVPDRRVGDGLGRALPLDRADATSPFEVGMVGTPKGKAGPVNRDGPNATRPAGRDQEPGRGVQAGDVHRRRRTPRRSTWPAAAPIPVRKTCSTRTPSRSRSSRSSGSRSTPSRGQDGPGLARARARAPRRSRALTGRVGQGAGRAAGRADGDEGAKAPMDPLLKVQLGEHGDGSHRPRRRAGAAGALRRLLEPGDRGRATSASCPG